MKTEKRIVRNVGESNIVTIPMKMCNVLGITENTVLRFEQIDDRITMTPIREA